MSDIASIYAVFASEDEARTIGRAMVEQRLAACVNILGPIDSIYRWEGAIEESQEIAALFKTDRDHATRLITAIAEAHSYDVPALFLWPVEATLGPYADWVRGEVG